jgi:hypothetical protein
MEVFKVIIVLLVLAIVQGGVDYFIKYEQSDENQLWKRIIHDLLLMISGAIIYTM